MYTVLFLLSYLSNHLRCNIFIYISTISTSKWGLSPHHPRLKPTNSNPKELDRGVLGGMGVFHSSGGGHGFRSRLRSRCQIVLSCHTGSVRKLGGSHSLDGSVNAILDCDMIQIIAGHHLVMRIMMMSGGGSSVIHHRRNIHQGIHLAPLAGAENFIGDVSGDRRGHLTAILLISVVNATMAMAHPILPSLLITTVDRTALSSTMRFIGRLLLLDLEPVLDAHAFVTASAGREVATLDGALGGVGNGNRHGKEGLVDDFDRCLDGILWLFLHNRVGPIASASGSCRLLSSGDDLGSFVRQWRELALGADDTVLLSRDDGTGLLP